MTAEPQWQHGKICYLILASTDPEASARFYRDVFSWKIRSHDNGDVAFDDPTGAVSGMWDTSIEARSGGYEVDIWVEDVAATAARIVAAGGELVGEMQQLTANEQYQRFADPDGNHLGLYQHQE